LLSHKFFGSAFALVRPIVEATVRSHVVIMGSEEDVRRLREDDYRANLSTVGKEIDTAQATSLRTSWQEQESLCTATRTRGSCN